jgi:hypothetical protein
VNRCASTGLTDRNRPEKAPPDPATDLAAAVADRDGIVRWQNARWTKLAGDCVGRPLGEQVAAESTHEWRRQFTTKVIGSVRTTDYEINMIAADGRHVPIDVSSVIVEGAGHRIVGVFGLVEPVGQGVSPPPTPHGALTPRQLEVLHPLDQGVSTGQIAARPGCRWPRRGTTFARCCARCVHSRLEALAEARRRPSALSSCSWAAVSEPRLSWPQHGSRRGPGLVPLSREARS